MSLGRDLSALWKSIDPTAGHWGTSRFHLVVKLGFVQMVSR